MPRSVGEPENQPEDSAKDRSPVSGGGVGPGGDDVVEAVSPNGGSETSPELARTIAYSNHSQADQSDVTARGSQTVDSERLHQLRAGVDGPLNLDFGDYELIEEIARGGMGVVFKARQKQLDRTVALKVILAGDFAGPEDIQRFQAEASAAANLQHSGIVPVFEVGKCDGRHFFSMGFIDGTTLADAVEKGPLDARVAATLLVQIADAVAFAHDRGVTHRDLKPRNILISADGSPHVTDFGLAKRADTESQLTGTDQILGTPSYMAPEQAAARNDEIGPRSDIYSLGAILYCLLTGRPPFQAANVMDTLFQVMHQEPVSPRQLNPVVHRDLETICIKCLQKEPSARYQTATALKEDLQRYLNYEPIAARPISRSARVWRWCCRNPVVASLSAALALLVLTLAVAGPSIAIHQTELRQQADQLLDDRQQLIGNLNEQVEQTTAARTLAEQSADALHRNLVQMYVERGNGEYQRGDPVAALPWYAAALSLDAGDAQREWAHRLRLASVFTQAPRPRQLWQLATENYLTSVSPDGKFVAAADRDGDVFLWDCSTGELIWRAPESMQAASLAMQFSADGTRLLVAAGRVIRVWNLETQALQLPDVRIPGRIRHAQMDPSARFAVVGIHRGEILLIDLESAGTPRVLNRRPGQLQRVAMNTQATRVVCLGMDSTAQLFALPSGELIAEFAHEDVVSWAEFDADGQRVVTSGFDGQVWIWSAADGQKLGGPLSHPDRVRVARFDPTGNLVATGCWDAAARIWDVASGRLLHGPLQHENSVPTLAFTPDARFLVTGSIDKTARLWDTRTGFEVSPPLYHGYVVLNVEFIGDGRQLMTASADRIVRVWDYRPSANLVGQRDHLAPTKTLCVAPSGDWVVVAGNDGAARIWRLDNGLIPGPILQHAASINAIDISSDGQWILTAAEDGEVAIWSSANGQREGQPLRHSDPVLDAEFSGDGTMVVTACVDGAARIWNRSNGVQMQVQDHRNRVGAVHFDATSARVLTCSSDRTARVWDVATGEAISPKLAHDSVVADGGFSPDGRFVVTASLDHTARVWEVSTGKAVGAALMHFAGVMSARFTADGRHIVTGATDGTARLWRAADGAPASGPLTNGNGLVRFAISPCGRYIATSGAQTAKLWDARNGQSLGTFMLHGNWVNEVQFTPDSRHVITTCEDGLVRVWSIPEADSRPVPTLLNLAHLISGHRADPDEGLVPLTPDELTQLLRKLRTD